MSPRERNKATNLHEKLQLLRSLTNSRAVSKSAILQDASKYIEELKEKVDRLNQEIINDQVQVQTVENGFLVTVLVPKSSPGLLPSVIRAFEGLGLNVLQARVSCLDTFRFEALGGENDQEVMEYIDAHVVKQAVVRAIMKCSV